MNKINLKVGDLVLIRDGSYAVRLDRYQRDCSTGLCKDTFEVIYVSTSRHLRLRSSSKPMHDIHIRNTVTGHTFLHSAALVKPVQVKQTPEMEVVASIRKEIDRLTELLEKAGK